MEGRGDGGSESGGESGWRRWEGGGGGRVRREEAEEGRRTYIPGLVGVCVEPWRDQAFAG